MLQLISWLILAAIHLVPALALFRPSLIGRLYGVETGSTAHLLLHHRAALFAVVLVLCVWAAFQPGVRPLAAVCVSISMLSFLYLFWSSGSPVALRTIAIADLIGLPFLVFVVWSAFRP